MEGRGWPQRMRLIRKDQILNNKSYSEAGCQKRLYSIKIFSLDYSKLWSLGPLAQAHSCTSIARDFHYKGERQWAAVISSLSPHQYEWIITRVNTFYSSIVLLGFCCSLCTFRLLNSSLQLILDDCSFYNKTLSSGLIFTEYIRWCFLHVNSSADADVILH